MCAAQKEARGARPLLGMTHTIARPRTMIVRPARTPAARPLRSVLLAPGGLAGSRGLVRELAPGLFEAVAQVRCGTTQILPARELTAGGVGRAALFHRARLGSCGEQLRFSVAAPRRGVHAYMLGGPGSGEVAAAALELDALLGRSPGPAGVVLAFPCHGTALFVVPGARRLRRALAGYGLRQFWCAEPEAAPVDLSASLLFLSTWAQSAYRRLPGPVSPHLYWQHGGRLSLLPSLALRALPRELAREVVAGG